MKERLIVALAFNLFTLTGCASTSTLDWLRDEHANAIAEDLVIAVAERVPPAEAPVYLADMPLRDHFESAIREHGYAVSIAPDNAIMIGGIGERIPPNTWHLGLTIDEGIRIHRLYHIEQDDVHALSAISVFDTPASASHGTNRVESSQWHLRTLAKPERPVMSIPSERPQVSSESTTSHTPTGSFLPVVNTAAPVPVTSSVSDCPSMDGAVFTFPPGSLKEGLVTALKHCGWSIVAWPNDSTDPRFIVDWIVTKETNVRIASIEDLVQGLRAIYGLEATIDERAQQISFTMNPTT